MDTDGVVVGPWVEKIPPKKPAELLGEDKNLGKQKKNSTFFVDLDLPNVEA